MEVKLPFSFSGGRLQTGLGTYSFSQSGSSSCNWIVASSSVNQGVVATAQSLMVTNVVNAYVAAGALTVGNAGASDSLMLSFFLDEPALVNLTESLTNVCQGFMGPGPGCPISGPETANASASAVLTGPGGGSIPLLASFMLSPGPYILTVSGSASTWTDVLVTASSTLSLDAEFTAIPEPRWLVGVAGLLLVGVHRIRRIAAQN